MDYGARFRTVNRIDIAGPGRAVAHLDCSPVSDALDGYLLHPRCSTVRCKGFSGYWPIIRVEHPTSPFCRGVSGASGSWPRLREFPVAPSCG